MLIKLIVETRAAFHKGFLQILGQLNKVAGLHAVGRSALSLAAQIGRVTEHTGKRHQRVHLCRAGAGLLTLDLTAAAAEVADDSAQIFVGRRDADLHDRFKQRGTCLLASCLKRHGTGDLERHFRRVDLVIGAVVKRDLHVDHGIACQNAGEHGALNTGIAGFEAEDIAPLFERAKEMKNISLPESFWEVIE